MNKDQIETFYPLTLAVRRLFHKLAHGATALHQDSDVSVGMRAVLESIVVGGPQTVPQMARVRSVSRQHIQGLVNQLMDGGYAEYAANPAHKRSLLVSPTERGRETFSAMRETESQAFKRLSLDLSPGDMQAATDVLATLIATLESPAWLAIVDQTTTNDQ